MNQRFDIAVIGGGAAGIAAALSAARQGCSTLLMDHRAVGGTGGHSGLTTLCGLFDDQGNFLNAGFSREFAERIAETPPQRMGKTWVLPYRPEKFCAAALALIEATPNLQMRQHTALAEVEVADKRIVRLNGVDVGAVIDCSGSGEVARAIGADCLETDETTQAPAVIFPLRNVTCELNAPAALARVLLPLARAGLPPLSFQPSLEPDTVTAKFAGEPGQVPRVMEILQSHVSGFENCLTPLTEFKSARRASRMIIGQYILTGADVLAGRKFPDAVARCAWPIEQWSADGRTHLRYLAAGSHYEIPARCLRAADTQNLFMGGKVISADVEGIASARVMGCCLATGAAAGELASSWLSSKGKS